MVSKATEPEARAPPVAIATPAPLELLCIEFFKDSINRSIDVLVVTEHFPKLACTHSCPNLSAKCLE